MRLHSKLALLLRSTLFRSSFSRMSNIFTARKLYNPILKKLEKLFLLITPRKNHQMMKTKEKKYLKNRKKRLRIMRKIVATQLTLTRLKMKKTPLIVKIRLKMIRRKRKKKESSMKLSRDSKMSQKAMNMKFPTR